MGRVPDRFIFTGRRTYTFKHVFLVVSGLIVLAFLLGFLLN